MCVCVYIYTYICMNEREREGERETYRWICVYLCIYINIYKTGRERERETHRFHLHTQGAILYLIWVWVCLGPALDSLTSPRYSANQISHEVWQVRRQSEISLMAALLLSKNRRLLLQSRQYYSLVERPTRSSLIVYPLLPNAHNTSWQPALLPIK